MPLKEGNILLIFFIIELDMMWSINKELKTEIMMAENNHQRMFILPISHLIFFLMTKLHRIIK